MTRRFANFLTLLAVAALPVAPALADLPAVPARWSGDSARPAAAPPSVPAGPWWQAFGDPALDALERAALAGNHDLQASLATARAARATARIAAAPLYPALAATTAYGRGTRAGSDARGIEVQAAFDVDLFGGNHAAARSAASTAGATEADARMAALTLSSTVAATYFEARTLAERIDLARKIASDAGRLLALFQQQRSLGAVSDLDVEQQRTATAVFAAAVPALQRLLDADKHLLSTLTGQAPGAVDLPTQTNDALPLPVFQPPAPALLIAQRPDIAAAEDRMAAAHFDVKAARAALLPHLSLALDGGVGADSVASLTPAGAIGGVLASLVQPLFQGGALRGRVRYSRAQLDAVAEQYWETLVTALRSVDDGLTDQQHLADYERETEIAVISARQAHGLSEARVQFGSADLTTLLLTQRALYQAEDTRLQIRQQRLTLLAKLRAASSSGLGLAQDNRTHASPSSTSAR